VPFNAGNYRSGRGVAIPATGVPKDSERYPFRGGLPPRKKFQHGDQGSPSAALNVAASQLMQRGGDSYYTDLNVLEDEEEFDPTIDPELDEPTYQSDMSRIQTHHKEAVIRYHIRKILMKEAAINTALDIAGLVPGVGEIADVTNALIYLRDKNYLFAALSLISVIPTIGDALGKGGKYSIQTTKAVKKLSKGGKASRALGKGIVKSQKILPMMGKKIRELKTLIVTNKNIIKRILDEAEKNEKLSPHVPAMKESLDIFLTSPEENVQEAVSESILRSRIRQILTEAEDDLLVDDEEDLGEDIEEVNSMGAGGVQGWTGPMVAPGPEQVKRMEKASSSFGGGSPTYKKKSRKKKKK